MIITKEEAWASRDRADKETTKEEWYESLERIVRNITLDGHSELSQQECYEKVIKRFHLREFEIVGFNKAIQMENKALFRILQLKELGIYKQ